MSKKPLKKKRKARKVARRTRAKVPFHPYTLLKGGVPFDSALSCECLRNLARLNSQHRREIAMQTKQPYEVVLYIIILTKQRKNKNPKHIEQFAH